MEVAIEIHSDVSPLWLMLNKGHALYGGTFLQNVDTVYNTLYNFREIFTIFKLLYM